MTVTEPLLVITTDPLLHRKFRRIQRAREARVAIFQTMLPETRGAGTSTPREQSGDSLERAHGSTSRQRANNDHRILESGPWRDLAQAVSVAEELRCGPESRIGRGRTWPAPPGTVRVKSFEIYRYDPDSGEAYRSRPVFTEATVPPGLLRSHRTPPGTWGLIRVLEGRLLYRVFDPPSERVLDPKGASGRACRTRSLRSDRCSSKSSSIA